MPFTEPFIAYIDESGNESLSGTDADSYFIISAIIQKKHQIEIPLRSLETIRSKYFQTGEMKSVKLASNHNKRINILDDFNRTNIKHATLIINKSSIDPGSGLQYKKSFRKFLPAKIYKLLFSAYENIQIISDEHGGHAFMQSVKDYLSKKEMSLFEHQEFSFSSSKEEIFIQAADIVSGSWRKILDPHIDVEIKSLLKKTLLQNSLLFQVWPPEYNHYSLDISGDNVDDEIIRSYCLRQVVDFQRSNQQRIFENSKDAADTALRMDVIDFLYNQCVAHENEDFITAKKIIVYLKNIGYEKIGNRKLSNTVFSHLRDHGVIISSGNKGYKIPTSVKDILEYVITTDEKTIPMIRRLHHAREQIALASKGTLDIINIAQKETLDKLAKLLNEIDTGISY